MKPADDVIAAIATPPGESGIAIIRVSGALAIPMVDALFHGRQRLVDVGSHTLHHGTLCSAAGESIDEVIIGLYVAPHSYTGENCIEINCHGGRLITRRILDILYKAGARPADPGEFTKRAFLNGRLDLVQAEAVADLIHARSEVFRKTSLEILQGKLSSRIKEIRDRLVNIQSLIEVELDFAEENATFIDRSIVLEEINSSISFFGDLVRSYELGKLYRDGAKAVIVGKPNVGKSSILNYLLDEKRAIVTDVPGTTRDTIEESLLMNGMECRIVDTAGLRESADLVEKEGIIRTIDSIHNADLILLVVDKADLEAAEVAGLVHRALEARPSTAVRILRVCNKCDLIQGEARSLLRDAGKIDVFASAVTGEGMEKLRGLIREAVHTSEMNAYDGSVVVTSDRQRNCLEQAKVSLERALEALLNSSSGEFVIADIREATGSLSEIIGEIRSDDILDRIFSKFCIGK